MPQSDGARFYRHVDSGPLVPFSHATVANNGYEFERVIFSSLLPLSDALGEARNLLHEQGYSLQCLAGLELRSGSTFTQDEFDRFNEKYRIELARHALASDVEAPMTRTNVVPSMARFGGVRVYGFTFARPHSAIKRSFVLSGIAERSYGDHEDRVKSTIDQVSRLLADVDQTWSDATDVVIYTTSMDCLGLVTQELVARGRVPEAGVRWVYATPPVRGLEVEIGVSRVGRYTLRSVSSAMTDSQT